MLKAMAAVDEKTKTLLEPVRDEDITPEHRAWMNAQIRDALDRKKSGQATFKSLADVRREFEF
jgi:hypothetical protein